MKHKLGIIGFGGMAKWHFENCPKTGCIEPAAVYDIDPERVKMGEDKGVVGFHSLEEFLDSRLFDVVLVATPNNFHHDLSVAALRAGYHVICEKPVTMTVEELKDVFRVADACGKLFTVHQNRRWDADFNIVRKAIETGMVGKPYTIESCVHGSGGVVHGWREYKVAGGGMLYLKLILTFANHLDVQIEVGTYCLKAKPRWYVNGTEGSLILEDWDCHGSVIHSSQTAMEWEPVVVQTKAGPTRTMAPRPKETLEELPLPELEPGCEWENFYRNVCGVIDGTEELIVRHDQMLRVMQVVEAGFRSAEAGHSVPVEI